MKIEISKDEKVALLFGASGLVGGYCLDQLLISSIYKKVIVFNRRKLELESPKLEQHLVDFDHLEKYHHLIKGDDLYCTLGTTMAKAGSKEAFFKVDFTYVYEIAQIAARNNVNQLLLVTAVGASEDSLFFYNRVKGQLENAVKKLPFWAIHIFQPSILLGERNENRLAESIAAKVGRTLNGLIGSLLSKYRPVEGEEVAAAMLYAARQLKGGVHLYPSDQLVEMGKENKSLMK